MLGSLPVSGDCSVRRPTPAPPLPRHFLECAVQGLGLVLRVLEAEGEVQVNECGTS